MQYLCSIIITVHSEGMVLHRTLKSATQSIDYAYKNGKFLSEIVIIKDSVTDSVTLEVLNNWESVIDYSIRTYDVDFKSLSLSRNFGISKAKGEYISILDGDDLYTENWINEACSILNQNIADIVHPQVIIGFPYDPYIRYLNVSRESKYLLFESNQWPALLMAKKKVFLDIPYVKDEYQFAYQDWLWNCQTLAKGYSHLCADNTLMAVRQKEPGKSLWQKSFSLNKVVRPNQLFKNLITHENNFKQIPSNKKLFLLIINHLKHNNPSLFVFIRSLKRKILTQKKRAFPPHISDQIKKLEMVEPIFQTINRYRVPDDYRQTYLINYIPKKLARIAAEKNIDVYFVGSLDDIKNIYKNNQSFPINKNHIVLITDEHINSAALHENQSCITGIKLNDEKRGYLLLRIILESQIGSIIIYNSKFATQLFIKYKNILNQNKILLKVDTPSKDSPESFTLSPMTINQLSNAELFHKILLSNHDFKNYILKIYGISEDQIGME